MEGSLHRFVRLLRLFGVRVSVAEAADAMLAAAQPGVLADRPTLRAALRVTLIKDRRDDELFDELFTAFFWLRPVAGPAGEHGHSHAHDDLADTVGPPAAGAQSRQAGRHQGLLPPGRSRPAVQPASGSEQDRPGVGD